MSPETQLRLVSTPFSGLVQRGIALNFGGFFRFGQIKNGQEPWFKKRNAIIFLRGRTPSCKGCGLYAADGILMAVTWFVVSSSVLVKPMTATRCNATEQKKSNFYHAQVTHQTEDAN